MDYSAPEKKRSKKDKARDKHERNGGFSAKHVRLAEARAQAGAEKQAAKKQTPKQN
jgi:hypothetical protein